MFGQKKTKNELAADFGEVVKKLDTIDNWDEGHQLYSKELRNVLYKHAPLECKIAPDKPSPPWLTKPLEDTIR